MTMQTSHLFRKPTIANDETRDKQQTFLQSRFFSKMNIRIYDLLAQTRPSQLEFVSRVITQSHIDLKCHSTFDFTAESIEAINGYQSGNMLKTENAIRATRKHECMFDVPPITTSCPVDSLQQISTNALAVASSFFN